MFSSKFTFVVLLVVAVAYIWAPLDVSAFIVCPKDPCKNVKCQTVHCCEGEVERPGFCGCCTYCAKVIPKGGTCLEIVGGGPPPSICAPGTVCINGTCQYYNL